LALEVLPLNEIAFLIDNSEFTLCSDTGLAHLSAVVGTPSLTLYGPTDTRLIGTYGENQNHFVSPDSDISKISVEDVLTKLENLNFL
jgi:heptosyltransferase-1